MAGTNDGEIETTEILVENHASVYNDSTSMSLASNDLFSDAKSAGVFFPTAYCLTYTFQRALQLLASYQVYGIHRVCVTTFT